MKRSSPVNLYILLLAGLSVLGSADQALAGTHWSTKVRSVKYTSEADNSYQRALVYTPKKIERKRPLLVALHTWSYDYKQTGGQTSFGDWCIQNDWFMIHPNFRGRNRTPQALGSDLAVADIVSAVDYMKDEYAIDEDRIYLCGVSGGGHMSLLMAGRHPEIWAGVSAWCGITDIRAWWEQKSKDGPERYARDIEKACGGEPDKNGKAAEQCRLRSPLTYLENAGQINIDINHGIHDGRKGSVPFTHGLYAYNKVVPDQDELTEKDINSLYTTQVIPEHLQGSWEEPVYGENRPLFRKSTATCRITIFDGSHEIVHEAALNWLNLQRKGKPATWNVNRLVPLE